MKMFIKGIELDLPVGENISRTLQVNDIATLSNRQSNYTNTYSLTLTAKNIRAMDLLGIVGNDSFVPYQRNECFLYADSGECLIYNGWALITATGKEYKINVYDGNIDLYKAIENRSLAELPLSEISHLKNLSNVINSWDPDSPYKYIIADYNGKMLYDTDKINIDYLVPSVHVPYLWDKIFSTYNFTYEGSVFDSFNFQNLWMTFPKGIGSLSPDIEVFNSGVYDFTLGTRRGFVYYNTFTNDANYTSVVNTWNIVFSQATNYKINIDVNFRFDTAIGLNNPARLMMGRGQYITNLDNVVTPVQVIPFHYDQNMTNEFVISVEAGENIFFYVELFYSGDTDLGDTSLDIIVNKSDSQNIDFASAFIDFKTKDFLNEVLTRLSITPYKDKYTNNYRFLTLEELLQDNSVIDWSAEKSKFVRNLSERYTFGSYAQKNDFNYKYNDQEGDYNNGSITIDNVNLDDERTVLNSRIYSPERIKTDELFKPTNIYKLWDKEVKDNGAVTYKPLDKRYYFMRFDTHYFDTPKTIGSEVLAVEQSINSAPYESFFKLDFSAILQDYYAPINQILNKAKIVDNEIYLHDKDIEEIDFSKLYWIRELNSYFLLNKVNNYQGKGITKCEMIKVDYSPVLSNISPILTITFVESFLDDVTPMARYAGGFNTEGFNTSLLTYVLDGGAPVSIGASGFFGFTIEANMPPVNHTIFVTDGNLVTNTVNFSV